MPVERECIYLVCKSIIYKSLWCDIFDSSDRNNGGFRSDISTLLRNIMLYLSTPILKLLYWLLNPQLLHTRTKRARVDFKDLCSTSVASDSPVGLFEDFQDMSTFDIC